MESIIIAIVGSGAFSALIAGVFNLIVNRKGRLKAIEDRLDLIDTKLQQSEKDELRTQLLLLLSDYPHETAEILKISEHYFADLEGNWYCTSLFNKWLEENDIAKPEWFKGGKKE